MNKIDIIKWHNYKIGDLFKIESAKGKNSQQLNDGNDIPYIAASKERNGFNRMVSKEGFENWISEGNCIQLIHIGDAAAGYANYIPNKFIAMSGKSSCAYNKNMTKYSGLFIAAIISKTNMHKYSFKDSWTGGKVKNTVITLPYKTNTEPDWEYMESYMKNIMQESEKNIEKLNNIHNGKKTIDILGWREFSLGGDNGLFRIVKGTRLTKANMKDGNINFIGSSSVNNGITNHISNLEHIHPANLITVSYNGSIGEAFYQEKPFWASDDVNVFYPNFKQSFEIAMFLIPLIRKIGQKYKFVDKWKLEDMCNDKITLPINGNGEPDWEYMENYMKNIMNDTKAKLNILKTAI